MDTSPNNTPLTGISVSQALDTILSYFSPLEPVEVPFTEALGLVLAEDVHSDIDIPPFDNSSMDGYAVRAGDTVHAGPESPSSLRVKGYVPAGKAPGPEHTVGPGEAVRIMTGAPMPPGADAVVPFEDTNEGRALASMGLQPKDGRAAPVEVGADVLVFKGVKPGSSVRVRGGDMLEGAVVLKAGATVRPAEIGVMASVGKTSVFVHRRPRVAILATGDELVDADQLPGPGQIRNSNNYAAAAQVRLWGGEALNLGIARDTVEEVEAGIQQALDWQPDMLVTSAGVSVGDMDVVKDVLMSMGSIAMWRVKMRPGKPLAFGRIGDAQVPYLGLPGNPVSSMVSLELYGRPAIMKMLGKKRLFRPMIGTRALEPLDNRGGRESYLRGIVTREGGEYTARLTGDQGSSILTSMAQANALLVIDADKERVEAGEHVQALMLDWPEEVF